MASSHLHFFLIFTFLLIATSLNQTQARESRFFSKSTPYDQPTQGEEQQKQEEKVDFTPLSAFKESSSPSQENQSGHGLYGHDPTQFPPTTTTTMNPETESAPLDLSSFRTAANEYNSFASKDLNSGFSGFGMSDTRLLENGKYFYDLQKEGYQNGFPDNRGTSGSGFQYPTENRYGGYGNENRYEGYENRYGGYNGNQNRYGGYGSNEENRYGGYSRNQNGYYLNNYYNQEEQDMFIP
ncbi:protein E6-like [Nymphaea colorata]|uniref:protein E6-like n=1 Tax=Nymphaea colorata TaxID=210225 RepID=UPI00129D3431|nr:protein E6-like [Nymphaea colorata]